MDDGSRNEYHESPRCGAKTRNGTPCKRPAGAGTQHVGAGACKLHGGSVPNHQAKATRELAQRACMRLGIPVEINPADALLHAVWEAAGNVEFYRQLVEELEAHPEEGEYSEDSEGKTRYRPGKRGIYGETYHISGIPTGEATVHVLVQLYNEERDRLVKYSSEALRAGVEERRVRLAESEARVLFAAVGFALSEANLSLEQQDTIRRSIAIRLRSDPIAVS